ncbi:MAG: Crp/Fnr family transcriptional regulator [Bacteroidota bacterium]
MIKQYIESVIDHFSDAHAELLKGISRKKILEKDALPLEEGKYCNYLWFLEEGAIKAYESIDGVDRVTFFYTPNNFFSNYYCWVTGDKSDITYQAVERCQVIEIDYHKLEALCVKHHIFDRIGRKIAQKLFVQEVQLRKLLLNYTAAHRYEFLENNHPEIFQHFALKDIASFIGITDVSLSRIRRERIRNQRANLSYVK